MKVRITKNYYEKLQRIALDKIIESYIKQEKYEDLNIALSAHENNLSVLYRAIDYWEPTIIKAILDNTKKGDASLHHIIDRVISSIDESNYFDSLPPKLLNKTEKEFYNIKSKIINLLINFKMENIKQINTSQEEQIKMDQNSVEILAQYNDDTFLVKFIEDNKIDVLEFKDTMIPYLLFKEAKLITQKVPAKCAMQEVLLARTYLIDLDSTNLVESAYTDLLGWPETKKILSYVATEIVKGDKLKILFTTSSYYNPMKNLICIELHPQDGFTKESIIAHEFSHFVMEKLYKNESLPFQISSLKNILLSKDNQNIKSNYSFNCNLDKLGNEGMQEASIILAKYLKYDQAALEPLRMAEDMLSFKVKESINNAIEYTKYLKECTLLPLFYLSSYDKFSEKAKKSLYESLNKDPLMQKTVTLLASNLLELDYIKEKEDNHRLFADDNKSSLEYLLNTCLPLISEKFKLFKCDIQFLERVADILFRKDNADRGTEHIVRYPEFAVMSRQDKLLDNPKILKSFKLLANYWDDYIIKDIDQSLSCFKNQNDKALIDNNFVELTVDHLGQLAITDFYL